MLGVVTREELQPLIDATPLKTRRSAGRGRMVCGLSGQRRSFLCHRLRACRGRRLHRPIDDLALVAHCSLKDFDAAELKDAEAVELERYRLISAGR